jgi:acetyltransferase-like isoleucine patch superfamily enzyme
VSGRAVTAARTRLGSARGHLRSLRPTRRTSHWEVGARPAPDPSAFRRFGDGSLVVPPADVQRPELVTIGRDVLLHEGLSLLVASSAAGVEIGDGTVLSRHAHIACRERVTLGRFVSSSDHVAVLDTWGPVDGGSDHPIPSQPVRIGDGAYLGFGCIVGPGVTVGDGAFIGEGAVVLDDVPPHTVVYGNPAVPVRRWSGGAWTGRRFP